MRIIPTLRRNILEPLWSLYTGAKVREAERELDRSQHLAESELRHRQWMRLGRLLQFAHDHNVFYRARLESAGVHPSSLTSIEDFRRIPILTKAEVRFHGKALLSTGVDPATLMRAKTGGSTGKPIELLFTEEVSQLRAASGRRHRRWSGWKVGEPTGTLWGNPVPPATLKARLSDWLFVPGINLDTMSITPESVRKFERAWVRVVPTLLFGHAHSLFVLASMVEELGVSGVRPRAIIASSMMLLPHERAVIERVFGVKVTDLYGCEEVGLIASECERHEGLHVNIDQLVVEVLRDDGTPADPGESGLVVVTDLINFAMPFIRYRLEDLAEIADRPCSCGRGLPLLRRVTGRTADFLKRSNGSRVAGISLIENTLTRIPGIEQMQIVQESLSHIRVRLVPGPEFSHENREILLSYFRKEFAGAQIDLEEIVSIAPEPNGKYRFSICRVVD
jgi:phenylacetate-CoA ligase